MPRTQRKLVPESLIEVLQNNGKLFTIFSIAVILVSGISIIENRDNWWVLVAGLSALFLAVFLYMNARIFIKVVLVVALNVIMSLAAFQVGSFADMTSSGGVVWMAGVLFSFFSMLAISYALTSAKSRWGTIGLSSVLGFIITYTFGVGGLNISLAALIGSIASILIFLLFHRTGNKNKYSAQAMPTNLLTEPVNETIIEVFENNGWSATSLKDDKSDTGTVLVWEDRGYVLYPVYMDESFTSVETKRTAMLAYKDNDINPWLLNLVFTKLPIWRSRNANLNLILLDLANNNGKRPRVIGVKMPDTKKPIPVGIIPAESLVKSSERVIDPYVQIDGKKVKPAKNAREKRQGMRNRVSLKDPDDVITMIDAEMSLYTKPLKKKQKVALSRIGVMEEDIAKDSTRLKKPGVLKKKDKKTETGAVEKINETVEEDLDKLNE